MVKIVCWDAILVVCLALPSDVGEVGHLAEDVGSFSHHEEVEIDSPETVYLPLVVCMLDARDGGEAFN